MDNEELDALLPEIAALRGSEVGVSGWKMISAFGRDHLANYKVPKQIIVLEELTMLPIGKVGNKALAGRAR